MTRRDKGNAGGIRDTADRYKALFDNMSEGFVVCEAICDPDGKVRDYWVRAANPIFVKRAPYGPTMVGRRQLEIRSGTSPRWFAACSRALAGAPVRFEYYDELAGRWYEVHMMRLSNVEFGQFFVDVTDRKQAESRQAQLFDELNHRVKNNLAVVSSILELQARSSPPAVRGQLAKAVDRIRSIADLHTALYRQKSSDVVDLCPYISDLGQRLSQSLFDNGQVQIVTSCEPISVTVGDGVNLGLIVNELVTNAAKHAFPEGSAGAISVSVSCVHDGVRVVVADDGMGFVSHDLDRGSGLGLRVVRSLAEAMGGHVRMVQGSGATVEVFLPGVLVAPGRERQQRLL